MSLSQDPSSFPATQASALTSAQTAASADPSYTPMAQTMRLLISLIGDNSSAALARGQSAFTDLSNQCRAVGVLVNGG